MVVRVELKQGCHVISVGGGAGNKEPELAKMRSIEFRPC